MSIQVLSDQTINKIAAGEVIENPASVVKELIENGRDAGAQEIRIEIERGGFSLIRVSDDGCGMNQDDLFLSIERHATSKIRGVEDLERVLTMGFRGEALASIGAVSKMKLTTIEKGALHGHALCCTGGKVSPIQVASRKAGSQVEVRSLFYNVPARLKFQKSKGASQNAITKLVTQFVLANPEIAVRYFIDGKEVIDVPAGDLEKRATRVLGEGFLKEASKIDFSENRCTFKGFMGAPLEARTNRTGQYLFVNGRGVISPQISRAIYEGFGTRLASHLHPIFILHLTLPPEWIDVNVHPQKREIRLREEKIIQEGIRRAVMHAFAGEKKEVEPFQKMEWSFSETPFSLRETFTSHQPVLDMEVKIEEVPVIGLFEQFLLVHPTTLIDLPNEDGMFLIDLERAEARILYERFLRGDSLCLQTLLIPITLEFSPHEKEVLSSHLEEIKKIGIDLRVFGDHCLIVDALCPDIEEGKLKGLLENLMDIFDENLIEKEREKKLALAASYHGRSKKVGWSVLEAKVTLKELLKTSAPYHCPKGAATVISLSYDTIKKLFQKKGFSI